MLMRITRISYATRIKTGSLLLLALTPLLTNLKYFGVNRTVDLSAIGKDQITLEENRFTEIRKVLPARGVVGYVNDETDIDEGTRKYYVTQYAIAPLIVVRGADRPLVVGDFSANGQRLPAPLENRTLIKDFGNGILLFGEEAK